MAMNVIYIGNSRIPSRTANSIHVMKMCQGYARVGHHVTLIVPDWKINIEKGVRDNYDFYGVEKRFRIRKVPLASLKKLDFLHRGLLMPAVAAAQRPAIVHSRGLTSAWGITKFFKIPTLFEIHAPLKENARRWKMFQQLAKNRHLIGIVVITKALAQHIKEVIPAGTNLIIAPDGVDSRWLEKSLPATEARRELGIDTGGRRLAIYTGHLYPGRGIELILELAKIMADHFFVIVGGRENEIRNFQNNGLPSNVRFAGFRPPAEMPVYLQSADVLLMPYQRHVNVSGGGDTGRFASPMKMFEYMSAGRPILASELPVLGEVLQHGENALLLPYDEPGSWANALRMLNANPEYAQQLGAKARSAAQRYTWENRARLLLRTVEQT